MRYLSMVNTVANPDFLLTNPQRDWMTGVISLLAEATGGKLSDAKTSKVLMKALNPATHLLYANAMADYLRGANKNGELKGTRLKYSNLSDRFVANGGMVSTFGVLDIETTKKNIEKQLKSLRQRNTFQVSDIAKFQ